MTSVGNHSKSAMRFAAWILRFLTALLLLAGFALYVFPLESVFVHAALTKKRDGCTVREALAGVVPAARIRKRRNALREGSRIIASDPTGYVHWRTPAGDYWAPRGDESLFFVIAELEAEPYGSHSSVTLKGTVVLDCGAHLGVFTRRALNAGAKVVVAIEPGPRQVECLRRTFAPEISAGRVIVKASGVWDKADHLELAEQEDTALSSFLSSSSDTRGIDVPVTTIDQLVADLKLSQVGFIKMDIEGAEARALAGASRTLRVFKPQLAIAAYHRQDDHIVLPALVLKANPAYHYSHFGCRLDLPTLVQLTAVFQ